MFASGPSLTVGFDVIGPASLVLTTRESPNREGSEKELNTFI
jgi:hypothetical protein